MARNLASLERGIMVEHLTLEEQEKVLLVAESYLREPESWVRGKWKCPVVPYGSTEQATDKNGNPVYQYCIQGAVHQAAYDVLGKERALELGAITEREVEGDGGTHNNVDGYSLRGGRYTGIPTMTERLGLDDITQELYRRSHGALQAMEYNDHEKSTHEGVLEIIRTKLGRVREALGKEKK